MQQLRSQSEQILRSDLKNPYKAGIFGLAQHLQVIDVTVQSRT